MRIRIQTDKCPSLCSKMAYSFIELLVAMAVLGVMFVSLYSGFSAGFAIIELARENLRATQILQEKMETTSLALIFYLPPCASTASLYTL